MLRQRLLYKADPDRIEIHLADEKSFRPLARRDEHFIEIRHGAVVKIGRRGPYAREWTRFVHQLDLRKVERPVAVVIHALLLGEVIVRVVSLAQQHPDQVQSGADRHRTDVDRVQLLLDLAFAAADWRQMMLLRVLDLSPLLLLENFLDHRPHLVVRHSGGLEIDPMAVEIERSGRVGADVLHRKQIDVPELIRRLQQRLLDCDVLGRFQAGFVASLAVLHKQLSSGGGFFGIDLAENLIGPARWFQDTDGFLDGLQILDDRGAGVAPVRRQRQPIDIRQLDFRAHAQRFAQIPCHGLGYRSRVLNPIKLRRVPDRGVADGRVSETVVVGVELDAENRVGDAADRVGAPEALFDRIQVVPLVARGLGEEGKQHPGELPA